MPELPEVETVRRDLMEHILNKDIVQIDVRSQHAIRFDTKSVFIKKMADTAIAKIERIGKLLIFHLQDEKTILLCHLRMTGQLIYQYNKEFSGGGHSHGKTAKQLPHEHTRLIFFFHDGSKLFFNDPRHFGYVRLIKQVELPDIYAQFGIEPLQKNYTLENFIKALDKKTTSIKAALLNQQLFAGIGNIYADEICFAARILPSRKIQTLKTSEKETLFEESKRIIALAINERGTTFNNYVDGHGKEGGFLRLLQVYQRQKKSCYRCGNPIQKMKVAQRGTHYCSECQV